MIYQFKNSARVPEGATPEGVLAELAEIEARTGKCGPEFAAKAVIAEPERYPVLRSFGPRDAQEAFENAIRDGITYAVRAIITVDEGHGEPVEVRALFLVPDEDGDKVWEPLDVVAKSEPYQLYLIQEMESDLEAYSRKLRNALREITRLLGG